MYAAATSASRYQSPSSTDRSEQADWTRLLRHSDRFGGTQSTTGVCGAPAAGQVPQDRLALRRCAEYGWSLRCSNHWLGLARPPFPTHLGRLRHRCHHWNFPGMFLSRVKIHRARNMVGKCVLLCCACIRQGRALPYSKPNVVGVIRHWLNRVPLKGSCAVAGHDLTLRHPWVSTESLDKQP